MKSIVLTIQPKQELIIPLSHYHALQGLVYELISYDSTLSMELHNKKSGKTDALKLFCFSDLYGKYRYSDRTRTYPGPFRFEIRCAEDIIVDTIAERITHDPMIMVDGCVCRISDLITYSKSFLDTGLDLHMNTPISVYRTDCDKKRRYFSPEEDLDYQFLAGNNAIQIDIEELDEEEAIEKVKEWYPDWKVYNGVEYLDTMVGGIVQQINGTVRLITMVVLMINVLITILMMKTFLAKERGDVALFKSLGFKNGSIRQIHVTRIVLILLCSIILGALLSHLLSPCILGPIFKMMGGSNIRLSQNIWIAYIVIPFILLTITGMTAFLCTGEVRNVEAREVNCME